MLDMPSAFYPLYLQKPIAPGESVEVYDAFFLAMAGEACPKNLDDWISLKLEVDALWSAQRKARLTGAMLSEAAQGVLIDDLAQGLPFPDYAQSRAQARRQVDSLRRFGTPTDLHLTEGGVDMDRAQARGLLGRPFPVLQFLHASRMDDLALALRLKRQRGGRSYVTGSFVPIRIVVIVRETPRRRKTKRVLRSVEVEKNSAIPAKPQQAPQASPILQANVSSAPVEKDHQADLAPLHDAVQVLSVDPRDRVLRPSGINEPDPSPRAPAHPGWVVAGDLPELDHEVGIDIERNLEDDEADDGTKVEPVQSDDALIEMLFMVIAGPYASSVEQWSAATFADRPVTGSTKLSLALAYQKHIAAWDGGLSADDILLRDDDDDDDEHVSSFDPDPDLSLFGPEFSGHYQVARLKRISAMASEPDRDHFGSIQSLAREWITLKRLSFDPVRRDDPDLLSMLEKEAERLSRSDYFG
jgi:hypothetical protein